jgi:hypothetical protein
MAPKKYNQGRAADAHAVLAPVLEGFSPTLEFPEIQEAETLLAALAASTLRRSGGFRSWHEASVRDVCSGVRPLGWTVSGSGFDSLPGVVILELCWA